MAAARLGAPSPTGGAARNVASDGGTNSGNGAARGDEDAEAGIDDMVAACAAFKGAICARDPHERTGLRAQLNLGHTLGHALEAATVVTLADKLPAAS